MAKTIAAQGTYDALVWAERQRCGGPGPKAVLLALARMAGLDVHGRWSCFPGQALLAEITEQSERTIRSQLAALEAKGLICREPRMRDEGRGRTSDRTVLLIQPEESAGENGADQPEDHDRPTGKTARTNRQPVAARKNQGRARSEEPDARGEIEAIDAPPGADLFDAFWAAYPRKVAKPVARKAFEKAVGKDEPAVIGRGLRAWRAYWEARGEPEFIPHPATWLNQERWNDEPPPARPTGAARYDALAVLDGSSQDTGGRSGIVETTAEAVEVTA